MSADPYALKPTPRTIRVPTNHESGAVGAFLARERCPECEAADRIVGDSLAGDEPESIGQTLHDRTCVPCGFQVWRVVEDETGEIVDETQTRLKVIEEKRDYFAKPPRVKVGGDELGRAIENQRREIEHWSMMAELAEQDGAHRQTIRTLRRREEQARYFGD